MPEPAVKSDLDHTVISIDEGFSPLDVTSFKVSERRLGDITLWIKFRRKIR